MTGKFAVFDFGFDVVAVHKRDEVETDFFGTRFMTFAVVRARSKEAFHRFDHGFSTFETLGLSLRDQIEMGELRRCEELCC